MCSYKSSSSESFLCFFFLCGTQTSHCCGLSHCGAQAPDAQAQRPWLTGPATPWHVGSSRTGARTRVPCIGRRILLLLLSMLFVCLFFAVRGPLTVVASPVAEHRLWTRRLGGHGSRAQPLRGMWESSRTGARTRVPCIGRRTLNHCATREAL